MASVVELGEVVLGALLGGHVVGVEAGVTLTNFEGDGCLSWWEATDAGDPKLDDEVAAGTQMASSVSKAVDLLVLGAQVPDGVVHQVDGREGAVDAGCRHVADRDGAERTSQPRPRALGHPLRRQRPR